MSITVSFTSLSKRENSTKQLIMSTTHDCNFKNGCSMLNPTLLLEINSASFPDYTAFKIEDRYYFVTDIRSVRDNLFEISGKVDILATYKANILATTAYVLYDSTANSELPDNRLPFKTTKSVQASTTACPLVPDSDGTYILSLTGSHDTTGIYKVSRSELAALIDDIQDVTDNIFDYDNDPARPNYPNVPSTQGTMIDQLSESFQYFVESLKKTIDYIIEWCKWWADAIRMPISQSFGSGNIPENIRECRWLPFQIGTSYGPNPIYLGTFKTKQSLSKLNTETVHRAVTVSIPWQANDYRRRSPYTDVYLYIPYIGMVKLSSENLVGQSSIEVAYDVALRDGSMLCTVSSGSEIIGQYPGNVGAEVPIGFSNINIPKAGQAIISGLMSINDKSLGRIGMSAINFGESVTPNFTCLGGLDGIAGIAANQNITCYTVFHDTIVAPNSELQTIGSPSMCPKQLANLTGYVQTMSASVDGAMSSVERTKLNAMLDAGIFIE